MVITSYLTIIHKVIIAGVLNFYIAALHFVIVMQEVVNMMEENEILNSTKDAIKFGRTLVKREREECFVGLIK